jgi:hypothetical protein
MYCLFHVPDDRVGNSSSSSSSKQHIGIITLSQSAKKDLDLSLGSPRSSRSSTAGKLIDRVPPHNHLLHYSLSLSLSLSPTSNLTSSQAPFILKRKLKCVRTPPSHQENAFPNACPSVLLSSPSFQPAGALLAFANDERV